MRGLAVVCLAAALVAGCGRSGPGAGGAGEPGGEDAAIAITAPADGQRLRARAATRETLRAAVRVRGRARPGVVVFLDARCAQRSCRARPRAATDGSWAATLRLTAPRAARFVTIDAGVRRDVVADGSAVATVELVGPGASRAQTAGERPRSVRARDGERGAGAASGAQASSRPAPPHDVLVIGDSLAEGMAAPLRAALPGWRVRIDALTSRPLATGMRILAADPAPPAILAFSLFTNDAPGATSALEAAVRATATRPGGCAVWSTIVRPPYEGVSYSGANTLLRGLASDPQLARGLELVDWAGAVAQAPSLLAGDGVHATPAGYSERARLYAAAIEACAGAG